MLAVFSNRVAVKIIWLTVSNVPSFCWSYAGGEKESGKLANSIGFEMNYSNWLTAFVLMVVRRLESSMSFDELYHEMLAAGRAP
jgi:hypothetical protein